MAKISLEGYRGVFFFVTRSTRHVTKFSPNEPDEKGQTFQKYYKLLDKVIFRVYISHWSLPNNTTTYR